MCALYCVVQSIVLLHDIMTRPFSSSLSFAQRRVLDAVVRRERLRQPNFVSDLVSDLGLRAESSLAPTLKRMERLGVVEIQGGGVKGRQRLVVSTEEGRLLCSGAHSKITAFPQTAPSLLLLPILGAIPAGPLEEVIASEEVESVGVGSVLRSQPGDFLLRIKGNSMTGDGIFDGDLVLLRPGTEAHQGEIAAVITNGAGGDCEATLKRIFWSAEGKSVPPSQADEVLLRASNPAYADMIFPAESVRIAGVFRGLIRQGGGQ